MRLFSWAGLLLITATFNFALAQTTTQPITPNWSASEQEQLNQSNFSRTQQAEMAQQARQACTAASDNFNKAKTELRKSGCGTPSSCEAAAERCAECTAGGIEEGGTCGGGSSVASSFGNMFGGAQDDSGHRAVVNRLSYCPIFSRDELERIREKKDDYKEKMEDAVTEIQDLTIEAEEAAGKIQDLQIEMQEVMTEMNRNQQRAIEDRSDELKAKLEDNNTALQQKLMEIEVLQADRQNKTQSILNRCHAQALEQVNALKERRSERINANQLQVQSLNELTALTSSRSRLQDQARLFFEQCKKDMRTAGDFRALEAEFQLKMKMIQNEVQAIQADSQQTIQKYSDQSQDRQLQRQLEDIRSEAEKDYKAKEREARAEQRKLEGLRSQIQLLQRRKAEAELWYNRYLEQEAAAGDNEGGDMTHTEFLSAYDDFRTQAATAYAACNCDVPVSSASSSDLNTGARVSNAACPEFQNACDDCALSPRTISPSPRITVTAPSGGASGAAGAVSTTNNPPTPGPSPQPTQAPRNQ